MFKLILLLTCGFLALIRSAALLLRTSRVAHFAIPYVLRRSKPSIVTLPPEILNEILKALDPVSLFQIRLTCKTLYQATKSRHLWHDLAQMCQSRPGASKMEESPADYTTEELEQWVLRRHLTLEKWNSPCSPRFQRRAFKAPINSPVVLPGGRWLLSMDAQGKLFVTDLDVALPTPKVLCEVEECITGTEYSDRPSRFAVWVDPREPRLTFRVAMVNRAFISKRDHPGRNALTRVHFFQARLVGHGSDAKIVAEPLRVMQGSFPGASQCETLDDHYLLQVKRYYRNQYRYEDEYYAMHVFQYTSHGNTPITTEVGPCFANSFYIIPHRRVVFAEFRSISIYSIPSSEETTPAKLTPIHTIPILLWTTPLFLASRTSPHIGTRLTTLLYLARSQLVAVHIPHDPLRTPFTRPLCANFFGGRNNPRAMGFSHCIAACDPNFLDVIACKWDVDSSDDTDQIECTHRRFEFPSAGVLPMICGFDEGTGRVVMSGSLHYVETVEVFDIVCAANVPT